METEYGIIKQPRPQPQYPVRELLVVPHKGEKLQVSYPAFGQGYFKNNIAEMQKFYSHPITGERISFREPTTSESISAAAWNFKELAKREIFDPRWLQLGYLIRTQDGVFTNTKELDEKVLKSYLDKAEKVNGIYFIDDKTAYAPYETFKQGIYENLDEFAECGLARLLEHTKEKTAKNLREIASPKFYKNGVNILGFDSVKEPILSVAGLSSNGLVGGWLDVGGFDWGGGDGGCAFGVLRTSPQGT